MCRRSWVLSWPHATRAPRRWLLCNNPKHTLMTKQARSVARTQMKRPTIAPIPFATLLACCRSCRRRSQRQRQHTHAPAAGVALSQCAPRARTRVQAVGSCAHCFARHTACARAGLRAAARAVRICVSSDGAQRNPLTHRLRRCGRGSAAACRAATAGSSHQPALGRLFAHACSCAVTLADLRRDEPSLQLGAELQLRACI
jgi:hypothetical protein